jgi:hypothetical protein
LLACLLLCAGVCAVLPNVCENVCVTLCVCAFVPKRPLSRIASTRYVEDEKLRVAAWTERHTSKYARFREFIRDS